MLRRAKRLATPIARLAGAERARNGLSQAAEPKHRVRANRAVISHKQTHTNTYLGKIRSALRPERRVLYIINLLAAAAAAESNLLLHCALRAGSQASAPSAGANSRTLALGGAIDRPTTTTTIAPDWPALAA